MLIQERREELGQSALGHLCEYCKLRNFDATSIIFSDFQQYQRHVSKNHPGYSIMAFPEDLKRFKTSLPFGNDYHSKLAHKMKMQLTAKHVVEIWQRREATKSYQSLELAKQQKQDAKDKRAKEMSDWFAYR